jgi:hypothetical protein
MSGIQLSSARARSDRIFQQHGGDFCMSGTQFPPIFFHFYISIRWRMIVFRIPWMLFFKFVLIFVAIAFITAEGVGSKLACEFTL